MRSLLAADGRFPSTPPPVSSACSVNVSPSAVALYVTTNPVNVATPATADTLLLADVALPIPITSSVTVSVKSVSTVPLAFCASTIGSVVKSTVLRLTPLNGDGWVANTSCVATTSDAIALASTVGRSVSTPSSSLAVSVNGSPSALAV